MMFNRPVPFKDAVGLLQKKELMPTTAGSAELKNLSADITRRAAFSAKVTNTGFLQRAYDLIGRIVDPTAAGSARGTYMDKATFRLELKNFLQSIGYAADEGKAGTIQDLASDGRLNLIADMNTQLAHGYGQFVQAQDAQVLDAFPAQELYRAGNFFSKLQRDWPSKWRAAGGSFYGGGRMIALKSDPIWMRSLDDGGFNRFGNPYPPFDYNSGMWVKPVSRDEAEGFGIIARGKKVEPTRLAFAPGLQNAVGGLAKTLQEALLESLGPGATISSGVLTINRSSTTFVSVNSGTTEGALKGWETRRALLGALYDDSLGSTDQRGVDYGTVSKKAEDLARSKGLDIAQYRMRAESDAIRHIDHRHGANEKRPNQVPVTREDIMMLPDVIDDPDDVEPGHKDFEMDTVVFKKKIGHQLVSVQQIRKGKRTLALKNMWKIRT